MKMIVKNWGPLKCGEFDFKKSLVIIYGTNSIGKSYAMQAMYLVLKYLTECAWIFLRGRRYFLDMQNSHASIVEFVSEFASDDGKNEIDVTDYICNKAIELLNDLIMEDIENAFRGTFGVYDRLLKDNPIITLHIENEYRIDFELKESIIHGDFNTKLIKLKKSSSDFHKSRELKNETQIYVYEGNIETPVNLLVERSVNVLAGFFDAFSQRIDKVYFLPASRSGIYTGMSSFGPIMAELSKVRMSVRKSFSIPNIPEPVSDYFMFLSNISGGSNKYRDIAKIIEKEILGGQVEFDSKNNTIRYNGTKEKYSMDMQDVSSMVSEISPIVAYLKYVVSPSRVAKYKDSAPIIFVEEPEAHLHPTNQIKLIRAFIKLTGLGVKLVLASHSNYIFNELNNRILAGEINMETYAPTLMIYKNGKSITRHMPFNELGVSDENFADVTDQLFEEREALIERILLEI